MAGMEEKTVQDAAMSCQCPACIGGVLHASDCAVHNAPAYPVGQCDCGASDMTDAQAGTPERLRELMSGVSEKLHIEVYENCLVAMTKNGVAWGELIKAAGNALPGLLEQLDATERTVAELRLEVAAVTLERDDLTVRLCGVENWNKIYRERAEAAEQRALESAKDAEIGKAINRACAELPEDYQVIIELERHAGTVRLCLPDTDATIDEFDGDGFVDYINSAIDAAIGERERG